MKKLLILLFMSFSLTVQSSTGPNWYDAPLKICFEAAEKGVFISKFNTEITIDTQEEDFGYLYCGASVRNFIYDGKEFSLIRITKGDSPYLCDIWEFGYAFCEYAEFNSPPKNISIFNK